MSNERIVQLYAMMIKEGKKVLDDVPDKIREQVRVLLESKTEE